ncbi:MAG TPA: FAD-binding oxidoreductase [Puia sp.]|jgi:ferredoxin-NADP reductase|nr:FAD-binding oxidoreductase [Puia sp.]
MESHIVKILSIQDVTHDVRCYRVEKPEGYQFVPGQATDVCINKEGWKEEIRPFTFTGLNRYPYLEFTIKSYRDHDGVTNQLYKLKPGDELIIHDVWGAISYKGPGYFIAGGAGITPFIAIIRELFKEGTLEGNEMFFSNKTSGDIIRKEEFDKMFGAKAHYILTQEHDPLYIKGPINKTFLQREIKDFSKAFYICGPDKMVEALGEVLKELGANPDAVVFEK